MVLKMKGVKIMQVVAGSAVNILTGEESIAIAFSTASKRSSKALRITKPYGVMRKSRKLRKLYKKKLLLGRLRRPRQRTS